MKPTKEEDLVSWPKASARVEYGQVTVTIAGVQIAYGASDMNQARDTARYELAMWAWHLRRPLRAEVVDPEGQWVIEVDEHGYAIDQTSRPARWWRKKK